MRCWSVVVRMVEMTMVKLWRATTSSVSDLFSQNWLQENSKLHRPLIWQNGRKMNRSELAKALNVWPWDIDDWLLLGSIPAERIRTLWDFDLVKVKIWLKTEGIKIKRIWPHHLPIRPIFDQRWFGERCPMCIDRGFPGGKAGRLYTLGEVSEKEWHLRRTGIPCGHSSYLNRKSNSNFRSPRTGRRTSLLPER